ncbi:hypothetical protein MKX03_008475, partial [Papaver bracteatum]
NYVLDEDDYGLLRDNNVVFHRPAPCQHFFWGVVFFQYLSVCGAYIACKKEMMQPNASIKDRFIWTQFPSNLMNALLPGDAIQDLPEVSREDTFFNCVV